MNIIILNIIIVYNKMLSNFDIDELVRKLGIKNFKGCFYKDKLKNIEPNSSYTLNLNSELYENNK